MALALLDFALARRIPMRAEATADKPRVMVVDDDLGLCNFLRTFLVDRGYQVSAMTNADDAVRHFHAERPDAVILDVVMPGSMDGLDALSAFKKIDKEVPVIVLSGQGRTATVVQAMKLGATDFLSKPFTESELEGPLANAVKQRHLSRELDTLREQLQAQSRYKMLFGHSEKMAEVKELIERVADTDVTVLIRGESGTGKELVARALYATSLRHDKPFVKVNCAALPTELLESELFGFERGAFTGALQQKPGKFEFANHGTMFLDEISEMSPTLQAKLLQVLQDGEFSRLGGKQDVKVDVRILASTNRDLERAVADGHFREDLFFRLNVVCITLPPLRQRKEEIPLLTDYFLKKYSVQYNKPYSEVSADTMRLFVDYDWPGNVRELENLIKRTVVLGTETPIQKELVHALSMGPRHSAATVTPLQPAFTAAGFGQPSPPDLSACGRGERACDAPPSLAGRSLKDIAREAARGAERELIFRTLQQTRWNRKAAAELLGISYKALLYKIKDSGLDKAS